MGSTQPNLIHSPYSKNDEVIGLCWQGETVALLADLTVCILVIFCPIMLEDKIHTQSASMAAYQNLVYHKRVDLNKVAIYKIFYTSSAECTQNIPFTPTIRVYPKWIFCFSASQLMKACPGMTVENQIGSTNLPHTTSANLIPGFLAGINAPPAGTQIGIFTSPMSTRGSLRCIEARELDPTGFQT
ncbi:hypothetical protein SO802_010550 [Lithocarpus litseifolius]|uniref:Uncharacterized protein n=1 Tax=Lithocarpus litseifolius TaxID=425828 RepID=A0AAW2DEI4_9ROSI